MTFKASVNECGQVTFPQEALDALGLKENSTFEFEVDRDRLIVKPQRDMQAFDAWAKKYTGSMREQFLAEGYTSVDEYMEEIRPKW